MKKSRGTRSGVVVSIHIISLLRIFLAFVIFLFAAFSISGFITSITPKFRVTSTSVQEATNITGKLLYQIMAWENHHFLKGLPLDDRSPRISNYMFKLSTNINLDDPRSLLGRELPGFSVFDRKILVAGEGTNYTNMPFESSPPPEVLKAENEPDLQNTGDVGKQGTNQTTPSNKAPEKNSVYVYFTHNTESYLPYLKGITDPDGAYHSKINVTQIGDRLKDALASKGIGAIIDKTDINARLNQKGINYYSSYKESRMIVEAAKAGNRDVEYLIDIHRDSGRKNYTTKVINNQPYAKLAFVIGESHPNYEKNVQFAKELNTRLEQKYKGLSRGIILSKDFGTGGAFNQDLSNHAILIEFGGVDNTFEELYRSAEALADVLADYYWQAEKVSQPVKTDTQKK